ncbi:MAG: glycosyltransferase family 39 protein [Acidobacteria bacterium]|nr:glycosyltransferase family 39 protein [Acidobacteriota bacterium]
MAPRWERLALTAILLLGAALRLWKLTLNGFGNLYYAAVARSMAASWHNFFYASYDPVGFLSSEKPPLATGLQALSAKLLSFHGLSLLLPSVIAGLIAIWAVYVLVRRAAGPAAALLSALVAALAPISVVMDRHNNPDSIMVALLTLAALFLLRATGAGKLAPLLASMVFVGLAFHTKMMAALIPVPAFFLAYLLGAPLAWRTRVVHLAWAGFALAAVCIAWPLLFDLTPQDQRPFAADSEDGSMKNLILGWNGWDRLTGRVRDEFPQFPLKATGKRLSPRKGLPVGRMQGPGFDAGLPGPLRFAMPRVAAQVAWLLPLALIGSAFAFFRQKLRLSLTPEQQCVLLCTIWVLTFLTVFSFSRGVMHAYYTTEIAPPLAALTGIGAVHLRRMLDEPGWRTFLLPLALLVTAAWQVQILGGYPSWRAPLGMVILAGTCLSTVLTLRRMPGAATAAGMVTLLLGPAVWSSTAVVRKAHPGLPAAGPAMRLEQGWADEMERGGVDSKALVDYLRSRTDEERILLAATSEQITSGIIVDTGAPVIAMGGFLGTDRAMSLGRLQWLIANKELRFILVAPFDRIAGNRERTEWVREHCEIVPARLWRGGKARPNASDPLPPLSLDGTVDPLSLVGQLAGPTALVQLFDCAKNPSEARRGGHAPTGRSLACLEHRPVGRETVTKTMGGTLPAGGRWEFEQASKVPWKLRAARRVSVLTRRASLEQGSLREHASSGPAKVALEILRTLLPRNSTNGSKLLHLME